MIIDKRTAIGCLFVDHYGYCEAVEMRHTVLFHGEKGKDAMRHVPGLDPESRATTTKDKDAGFPRARE